MRFIDKSAYTIGGYVSRRYTECGLDSIQLMGIYVYANGDRDTLSPVYTNTKGMYSITVNPFLDNLSKVVVKIASSRKVSGSKGSKTVEFEFEPQSDTVFNITSSFPNSSTLDFLDTLTYPVNMELVNACKYPLLGGQYQIRAKDEAGCYNQTFVTDNQGHVVANLPPINLTLNVEGVVNLTQQTELVVNYLRYRPQTLKMYDLHRDTLSIASANYQDSVTKQYFTYITPPTMTVEQGFSRYVCGDLAKPAIVESGKSYSLKFGIKSLYNGIYCGNKLGKIRIVNAAATKIIDTLIYSESLGGFPYYTFTAGSPNLVLPYAYTMSVEYRSEQGEILGIKNFAVIVEGTAAIPGSDVIVDLGSADQIKLPLYVVRKPPGTNSVATIEQGTSVTYEFGNNRTIGGGAGFMTEVSLAAAGVGIKAQVESLIGGEDNTTRLSKVNFSNTNAISTNGFSLTGKTKDASDVIVGTGIAAQYGLSQTIKVDSFDCKIMKFTSLQFTPNSIQTSWIYTVAHIQHLLDGYTLQKEQVQKGTLILKDKDGKELSKQAAQMKLDGYIAGWNKVLGYHRKETLPWYELCAHELSPALSDALPPFYPSRKSLIEEWRNAYCTDNKYMPGGQYNAAGKFMIKPENEQEVMNMQWSNERLRAYNVARTAIFHLENMPMETLPWIIWKYQTGALSDSTIAQSYLYMAQTAGLLSGVPAKNITFSGGVEYSESQKNVMTSSYTNESQFFLEIDTKIGLLWGVNLDLIAGTPFAGTAASVVETENWIGAMINFNYSYTTHTSSEWEGGSTTSFKLSDPDEYDQFSVTCIQGVNPAHTPYFSILGGRSSCPYEEGTIARDMPDIKVYDMATNSVSSRGSLYNVNPEETANFFLKISNKSVFNEPRVFYVYVAKINTGNAAMLIDGQNIQQFPVLVKPDEPVTTGIAFSRGPVNWDYTNIVIKIRPECYSDIQDLNQTDPDRQIVLDFHFKSPCSNITLLDPEDGWQIKRRNPFDPNSREQLLLKFTDYDTGNDKLKSARLEYRRLGANQTWTTIDGSEVDKDSLAHWDALNFLPGALRYYPFIWDITGNYTAFPDGDYEVRAVAECEVAGSDVLRGDTWLYLSEYQVVGQSRAIR